MDIDPEIDMARTSSRSLWCSLVVIMLTRAVTGLAPSLPAIPAAIRPALAHLVEDGLFRATTPELQALTNTRIPRSDGGDLLAYTANPGQRHTLLLLHEFFGVSASIVERADALADELGDVTVVAPDTFRGMTSTFIPTCIWLALSTPTERVNSDLDDVVRWREASDATGRLVRMVLRTVALSRITPCASLPSSTCCPRRASWAFVMAAARRSDSRLPGDPPPRRSFATAHR